MDTFLDEESHLGVAFKFDCVVGEGVLDSISEIDDALELLSNMIMCSSTVYVNGVNLGMETLAFIHRFKELAFESSRRRFENRYVRSFKSDNVSEHFQKYIEKLADISVEGSKEAKYAKRMILLYLQRILEYLIQLAKYVGEGVIVEEDEDWVMSDFLTMVSDLYFQWFLSLMLF